MPVSHHALWTRCSIVLGVLYALQWPAPALSDDTGAPRHIKRLMKVVMSLMHGGDLNRPLLHATSDGSQKLLWHLSFGANMNPKVRNFCPSCLQCCRPWHLPWEHIFPILFAGT